MMTSTKANIWFDLLCIHHAITRGLGIVIEYADKFSDRGFPDSETREGFLNYLRSLASIIREHHQVEDELAFPRLRTKIPDEPYETLTMQHGSIAPLVSQLNAVADLIEADPQQMDLFEDLHKILKEIDLIWHRHIALEEESFNIDKLESAFTPEEHEEMGRQFSEHSQQHIGPDYLIVPFLLYNLMPDERLHISRLMPPILTEQLVPMDWKTKWQSMQPFFLG